ncbi:Serine/threonine-protein kinase PrkC [Bremerella volcania]|uniref:Serine/threonine-protein kinase PrkC n=1 Tax=Bremerella volcania TaxID=2527984 RepID=A0A518CB70_9BACT|nr:serine/threonine-protein kinase [Bremerella volcania]QDU76449.1 Serine/threonine-protein kinase PrkC [Bremerella volcania]
MPNSPRDSDDSQARGSGPFAPSTGDVSDPRGSDSATADHLPDGRNFLEEPPTVISNKKGQVGDSTSRSYSVAELTLGKELVGQTLGHFQLDAFVGAGGMGAVFRGHDTQLDRRVAVKVLSGEHNTREDTVRRFRNEAQSAARLDHPNIARVYYVGEDKGWNYIVFEFIDGTNIRDEVERNGPLEIELAVSYLVQVAEALDHAATRDVVHRDIKPSNILVDSQHRAKLVDMGLARLHQVNSQDSDLTASGMTLGTFDYISPEQARDPRSADVRSDLYSLGCTFFFMLTGRPPFPEGTVLQKLLSHSGEEPPDPREFRPDVPDEVVHILSRLMAKNPNDRYQKPGELIAAALLLIDELNLAAPHVTSAVYVPTTEQRSTVIERHLPWVMPAIMLLVVVFVLEAIWTAQDDSFISGAQPNPPSATEMQPIVPPDKSAAPDSDAKPGEGASSNTVTPIEDIKPIPVDSSKDAGNASDEGSKSPISVPELATKDTTGTTAEVTPTSDAGPSSVLAAAKNVVAVPTDAATLYEAIAKAQADPGLDTIELRYSGELGVERPLILDNASLTIRAAAGYSPVIVFRPQEFEPLDRMILVSANKLSLQQVHVKIALPPVSMRTWSLFRLENAELELDGCEVTIQRDDEMMIPDALRRATAVVSALSTSSESTASSSLSMARYSIVRVKNSMVRGEASLIRTNGQQPLRVSCENSLLAMSGNLLSSNSTTTKKEVSGIVQFKLANCTIDTGGSVFQREGTWTIPLKVPMNDCIVTWGKTKPFLLQRSSTQTIDELTKSLDFECEDNVYSMGTSSREMMLLESTAETSSKTTVDYTRWKTMWDDLFSEPSESVWASPLPTATSYSKRLPMDYLLLDDFSENPAVRPDERNAGVDFSELPLGKSPLAGASSSGSTNTN